MSYRTIHTDDEGDRIWFNDEPSYGSALATLGAARDSQNESVGVYLDRAGAVAIISNLTDFVQKRDAAEATAHLAADVATAKALEIGTRVQISENPLHARDGRPANDAVLFAGKVGTIVGKFGEYAAASHGVNAGRVRVQVDGVVTGQGHAATDIHVSSLTVLPPEPEFKVGDRVEVHGWSEYWDGPATVTDEMGDTDFVSVKRDNMDYVGAFEPKYLRALPTPDYAALAASFKPGDLAIVGDEPSTRAEAGGGGVNMEYAGQVVTVVDTGLTPEHVRVRLHDKHPQFIHVAHLTKAKAVPA